MKINLIVIRTANLDIILKFYNMLGLCFIEEKHGNGPIHYSCSLDGVVLEIYPATNAYPVDQSTSLGFSIPSITTMIEQLTDEHIEFKIIQPDHRKIHLSQL